MMRLNSVIRVLQMNKKIYILDTTLRDGTQMAGFDLSLHDKLLITEKLDEFGIDYIEAGWPGSNDKDIEYFKRAADLNLKHARITAFGSTRRADRNVEDDPNIKALIQAHTNAIVIFGKTWDLHVKEALRTSLETNLEMIRDSLAYLKEQTECGLIYDAEHFFDGYKANPKYAIETIKAAEKGGAEHIVLCDTNGGSMPWEIGKITEEIGEHISVPLGIHAHNDSGLAAANTVEGVRSGAVHVHGTINGVGERTGNADICTVIGILQVKLGYECIPPDNLESLVEISRFIYEIANTIPHDSQPFVGKNAFTHKGGVHVNAVLKNPHTYEHIDPETVGNARYIPVSELSGRSNILNRLKKYDLEDKPEEIKKILKEIQKNESIGYQYEAANASFEILTRKILNMDKSFFDLEGFRVIVEKRNGNPVTEATIKIKVGEKTHLTAAEGDGPVNALDLALRKALEIFYPELKHMHLTDYKVRVINATAATAARVRVVIESAYKEDIWSTVGVSENLIEASWIALVDSINYMLMKYNIKEK